MLYIDLKKTAFLEIENPFDKPNAETKKKTHYISGQKNGHTVTACGLNAAKDGIIHVPKSMATCKNCKKSH